MSIKWTQQEDNLLKQLDALGYSSSKIYKEYGSILAASKGLTVSDNGNESVPMDMSGHKYSVTTANPPLPGVASPLASQYRLRGG